MGEKRGMWGILLSFLVTVAIVTITTLSIRSVDEKTTSYCFDELRRTSKGLATELHNAVESDCTVLSAMAAIIASLDESTDEQILAVMNSFSSASSYISHLEFLFPDGRLLHKNGSSITIGSELNINQEAKKGKHISGKMRDHFNPEKFAVHNAVPVVHRGRLVGILYGVILLDSLVDLYKTDIYDGNAYVYIEDGDTGDFLLDTWHKSQGTFQELGRRIALRGYDYDTTYSRLKQGIGGDLAFISKTTGRPLYLRHDPLMINNWNVMITVTEDIAMMQSRSISQILYKMAIADGIILILYMGCIIVTLLTSYRTVRRLSLEDQMTQLPNRNAYDQFLNASRSKVFPVIACIYADSNGLHEMNNKYGHAVGDQMLRTVANALKQLFPLNNVYRVGGDEFVVLCEQFDAETCARKIGELKKMLEQHDYTISAGLAWRQNEEGADRVVLEADRDMLENKRKFYANHERRDSR